jgi:hypothetical protein
MCDTSTTISCLCFIDDIDSKWTKGLKDLIKFIQFVTPSNSQSSIFTRDMLGYQSRTSWPDGTAPG